MLAVTVSCYSMIAKELLKEKRQEHAWKVYLVWSEIKYWNIPEGRFCLHEAAGGRGLSNHGSTDLNLSTLCSILLCGKS